MFARSIVQTPIFDIAHLFKVPTPEHFVNEAIVVGRMVAGIDSFKPVLVLDEYLFEDVSVPSRICNHQGALSWGVRVFAVQRFYHTSLA